MENTFSVENLLYSIITLILFPIANTIIKKQILKLPGFKSYTDKYKNKDYYSILTSMYISLCIVISILFFQAIGIELINSFYSIQYNTVIYLSIAIPLIVFFVFIYIKRNSGYLPDEGYMFIYIAIFSQYASSGFLLLVIDGIIQDAIVIRSVFFNGIAFFISIIFIFYIMNFVITNEKVKYKYIVYQDKGMPIISNRIIDNGNEVLISKEIAKDNTEFLLEIPKNQIRSIEIIKTKRKVYGNRKN